MAGLSRKEIGRLVEHIEPQGVTITNTKKGLLLRLPNGETAMCHWTTSDHRAPANLRASLRRAGVTWPGDTPGKPGKPLPKYITDANPTNRTLWETQAVLDRIGQPTVTAREFMLAAEWKTNRFADVYQRLYALGWRPDGTNRRKSQVWRQPVELDPEPTFGPPEPEDNVTAIRPPAPDPEPTPEPEPEVDEAKPEWRPPLAGETREFLDSVDSWTADLSALDGSLTLDQLVATMRASGLDLEIRMWRAR